MFLRLLFSSISIAILAYIIPGVSVTLPGVIVLAIVLGVVNLFIKPVLFVLTLPLTIITLGMFALVLNVLLLMLAASIVPGVSIDGFWTAALFSLGMAVLMAFFDTMAKTERHIRGI